MKVGDYVGKWEVIRIYDERANDGHMLVDGRCSICGFVKKKTQVGTFRYHDSDTCNHFVKTCDWFSTRLSITYRTMIARCYKKRRYDYSIYGGKGIRVCDEWLNNKQAFNDWAVENGYTDELTIDRVDPDKDYSPDNCRWITMKENSKWKSTTHYITVNGITDSGRGWSQRLGFGINYINTYIRKNGIDECIRFIKMHL